MNENGMTGMNMELGREKLPWADEVWKVIDDAVYAEAHRTEVAARFLPCHGPVGPVLTVPADRIDPATMTVEEGLVTPILEIWTEFSLTEPQVAHEDQLGTAVTLATRSMNLLNNAMDRLIFQGEAAVNADDQTLLDGKVRLRGRPNGIDYLGSAADVEPVKPVAAEPRVRYSEAAASAVFRAYARLQGRGHYGPYAAVFNPVEWGDLHEFLANTLIMPADRVKAITDAGAYGSGSVADNTGFLVSLGGNTMDLVIGVAPITAVMQQDTDGRWRFRVFERFALRLKLQDAVVRFDYLPPD
jgi:uncharacterized linocin/CFP29 family protein